MSVDFDDAPSVPAVVTSDVSAADEVLTATSAAAVADDAIADADDSADDNTIGRELLPALA
jgi:hypothetical protein